MKIDCPHCGVHGSVEDSLAGKKLKCPKCSKVFLIPEELLPESVIGFLSQKALSEEQAEPPVAETETEASEEAAESIEAETTDTETAVETETDDDADAMDEDSSVDESEEEQEADSDDESELKKCSACGQPFAEEFLVEIDSKLYCSLCEPESEEGLELQNEEKTEENTEEESLDIDEEDSFAEFPTEDVAEDSETDEEDLAITDDDDEQPELETCDECGESLHPEFLETVGSKRYCALCVPEDEELDDSADIEDDNEEVIETDDSAAVEDDDEEGIELTESGMASAQALIADKEEYDETGQPRRACSECGDKYHPDFLQEVDGKLFCGVCQPEVVEVISSEDGGEESADTTDDAQGTDFTIGEVLKESWQKTKGAKGAIWGGMIIMAAILLAVGIAIAYGLGGMYVASDPSTALGMNTAMGVNIGLQLASNWLALLFTAGLILIGVRRALGQRVSWKMVFSGFSKAITITVAMILQTILVTIGFCLLVIPGIYLSVGYVLVLPLILEKGYGPWQALEASRKAIHKKWWTVFGMYLVMGLIYAVSAIPAGLGLIWTVPMSFLCIGVLYRRLFVSAGEEDLDDTEEGEEEEEEPDTNEEDVEESEESEKEQ